MKIPPLVHQHVFSRLSAVRGNAGSSQASKRSFTDNSLPMLRDQRPIANLPPVLNRPVLQSGLSGSVTSPSDGRDRPSSQPAPSTIESSSVTVPLPTVSVAPSTISPTDEQWIAGGVAPPPTDPIPPSTISPTNEQWIAGGVAPKDPDA